MSETLIYLALGVLSCFPFFSFTRRFGEHMKNLHPDNPEVNWIYEGLWNSAPALILMVIFWPISWVAFIAAWTVLGIKLLCSPIERRLWHMSGIVRKQERIRQHQVNNEKRRAELADQERQLAQRWHQLTGDDQVPELQNAVQERLQAEADIARIESGEEAEARREMEQVWERLSSDDDTDPTPPEKQQGQQCQRLSLHHQ